MPEKIIGLIAAMPEEVRPLIRGVGPVTREKLAGFNVYRFRASGKKIVLIESGIGVTKAAQATRTLIDGAAPEVLLNFGLGGAVLPGPSVGDIVVADRLLFFKERLFANQVGLTPALTDELAATLEGKCPGAGCRVHRGTFVTTGEIVGKGMLAGLLPAGTVNPVLEMETTGVARIASERKIPLVAVRAISDGTDEELDFSVADFTDREMRIRVRKVLWTIARKPRIIPQLIRLERNSRLAGRNLATAILTIMEGL
jgi:adenosylhomocysteine nucleosidase